MNESQSPIHDKRVGHAEEECVDYWDVTDASSVIENGEKVEYEIVRPHAPCENCRGIRVRNRTVDLSLLNGAVVFTKIRVIYCPDCKTSRFEESAIQEISEKINFLSELLNTNKLRHFVVKELFRNDDKREKAANRRKVISVYFPTKTKNPAKAQISVAVNDPLFPALRSLTSENIRSILGLEFFEDLEEEASRQNRPISQYLKLELSKKVLDEPIRQQTPSSDSRVIELPTRKVPDDYLKMNQFSPELKLAAESSKGKEIIVLESQEKDFLGILEYDYSSANLFISVARNTTGYNEFRIQLLTHDGNLISGEHSKTVNKQLLLLKQTKYTKEDIAKIVLNTTN